MTTTGLTLINDQPGHRHMAEVCAAHGLTREQMRGWNKTQKHVNARKDLWFRLKFIAGFSWTEAARMTRKDHSTAIYGVRQWSSEHLGTHPKAKEAEIASAWAGYLAAMEFALALCVAPAGEYGNNLEMQRAAA
jgi:hypothetical protein